MARRTRKVRRKKVQDSLEPWIVDWIARWEKVDFSWSGLARASWQETANNFDVLKRWHAPVCLEGAGDLVEAEGVQYRQSTLQTYWRWVPDDDARLATDAELFAKGLLHEVEGKVWHAAFIKKPELSAALTEDLRMRLLRSMRRTHDPDPRMQLVGVRAPDTARTPQVLKADGNCDSPALLTVRAEYADLIDFKAGETSFGDNVSFEHALFRGQTDFSEATFGASARFDFATFSGPSEFFKAKMGPTPSFSRAVFHQRADFQNANLGENADFRRTRFVAGVGMAQAEFGKGAQFERTKFEGDVDLQDASLLEAKIESVEFGGAVDLTRADLSHAHVRNADLSFVRSWRGARLSEAEFANVTYDLQSLGNQCEGLKGLESMWGDALLKRDLADQDYIDSLKSRLMRSKPVYASRPISGRESVFAKLSRYGQNVIAATGVAHAIKRPTVWLAMLFGAICGAMIGPATLDNETLRAIDTVRRSDGLLTLFNRLFQSHRENLVAILVVMLSLPILTSLLRSWYGRRAVHLLWARLGYGRDWDRVVFFAGILIALFGFLYQWAAGTHVSFDVVGNTGCETCSQGEAGQVHWFTPWFVAAMGFSSLGVADVATPLTGLGQLLMIANVLAGFTTFGLLLAVLSNRFARRA